MPQFDDQRHETTVSELHHKEEEALLRSLAPKYGYQYVDFAKISINPEALPYIPEETARKAEMAPFEVGGGKISVAIRNPKNPDVPGILESLKAKRLEVTVYMASEDSLKKAWVKYGDVRTTSAKKKGVLDVDPEAIANFSEKIKTHTDVSAFMLEVRKEDSAERITKTIEVIFGGALALGASDIHIEPEKSEVRVRYRLDGVLWNITDIEQEIYGHLISRLKLLSGLKLNVRSEAQDGRFTFDVGTRAVEIRSSIIPGAHGESMVMRLLDPDASSFNIESLGLNKKLREVINEELSRPNGALITTGPTGSGKTTALYAFLQSIHKPEVKIITIEDPVEYKLPGIVQTQVGDDYTFQSGLRAVLRQDPDVIMVGEIRDREVAETAVHAALTGHLVFSTLHTNSAAGAFPRLIDIGIDPRMIGSAFNIILGQRLVRRLCEHCRVERQTTTEEQVVVARIMAQPVAVSSVYDAPGCEKCGGSGYRGRIGIYEGIRVDKAVEEAAIQDPRESNILEAAKPQGIPTMQQDGVMKVLAGITSFDELSRVIDLYEKGEGFEASDTKNETPEMIEERVGAEVSEHTV